MRLIRYFQWLFFSFLACSFLVQGEATDAEKTSLKKRLEIQSKITQSVKAYLNKEPSRGFSLAVYYEGDFFYLNGWGTYDIDGKKRADETTTYRIASISKAVTATLAHRLQEQKKIVLDSPVTSVIKDLASHHNYQISQLLSHRSGVCHYDKHCKTYDGTPINLEQKNSMWPAVEQFHLNELSSRTGDIYYSTHAYSIIANALEQATDEPFSLLMQNHINLPLGTQFRCENLLEKDIEHSALFRLNNRNNMSHSIEVVPAKNIQWKCAGGGMQASVVDLVKLGAAVKNNLLFSDNEKSSMLSSPDEKQKYGVRIANGWDIYPPTAELPIEWFGKSGDYIGARSYLRVYPESDLIIALAGNTRGQGHEKLVDNIARLFESSFSIF